MNRYHPTGRGRMEQAPAVAADGLEVSPLGDQEVDGFAMSPCGSQMERRLAKVIYGVNFRPALDQFSDQDGQSSLGRRMEHGSAAVVS